MQATCLGFIFEISAVHFSQCVPGSLGWTVVGIEQTFASVLRQPLCLTVGPLKLEIKQEVDGMIKVAPSGFAASKRMLFPLFSRVKNAAVAKICAKADLVA